MTITSIVTLNQLVPLALEVTAAATKKDGVPKVDLLKVVLGEHDILDHLPESLKLKLARSCEDDVFAPRTAL